MLEAKGVEVSSTTQHEVIESIYFRDPNGYFVEITVKLRELQSLATHYLERGRHA